jgi:dTMP kinase
MFPVAAGAGALLAKAAERLPDEGWVDTWRLNQEGLAFYVDGFSFLLTALIVWRIALPTRSREERRSGERIVWDLGGAVRELREGWKFIAVNPIVRAVNVGLATGVMGGGLLVPLGAIFVNDVIHGRDADFQLVLFAMGTGMALGVLAASVLQNRINRSRAFPVALIMAGGSLFVAASAEHLTVVVPVIALLGFWAGPIYVMGFTLLHENVDDEMRGRIFAALLVLVRLCMLVALAVAPLLSELLDRIADDVWGGELELLGMTILTPGVRITMWLAALIIIGAGALASWSLRAGGVTRAPLLAEAETEAEVLR